MLEVARLFRGAGAADDAALRLLAVYADNLRRIAKAEEQITTRPTVSASAPKD